MDWKFVLDTRHVKQMFFTLNDAYVWVRDNTSYPFFLWDNKLYMNTDFGPGHTDYVLFNSRIINPNDVIGKISFALYSGRLKCIPGKRIWNGYEIEINEVDNFPEMVQIVLIDKDGKSVTKISTTKPKKHEK